MQSGDDGALLERGDELAIFESSLSDLMSGSGRFVIVEGPSGIGKTRLLAAAAAAARAVGARVLAAAGDELEREYPLGFVRRLLERQLDRMSDEERARLLRGHAELAGSVLASAGVSSGDLRMIDEAELTHSLFWLLANFAEQCPVVILADDLQWSDRPSLLLLDHLSQRLDDLPLLVVGAVRTGDPAAASELVERLVLRATQVVAPRELSREGVRALMSSMMPTQPGDQDVDRAWTLTRGNPFLLRHHTVDLASGRAADGVVQEYLGAAPDPVARSVTLRLKRLGQDATGVARAVSVLGPSTPVDDVVALTGLSFAATVSAAQALRDAQIFAEGSALAFYHPMLRAAVYSKFPASERADAHLAAARTLWQSSPEVDRVASHLARATPTTADWARSALRAAARDAARKGAPATAAMYVRQILRMGEVDQPDRASLLLDLGMMEAATGEGNSLSHLEEALKLIDVPTDRERAIFALGQTLFRYGRAQEAQTVFRRGADEFAAHAETALRFEAGFAAAAAYLVDRAPEAHARLTTLSAPFLSASVLSPAERLILLHLGVYRAMCLPDSASHAALIRRALGDGVQLWRDTSDGMVIGHAILALTWCGFPNEAAQLGERMLVESRGRGDSLIHAEVSLGQAMARYALGDVDVAMAHSRAAMEGMSQGWMSTVPAPEGILAYGFIDRGDLDAADAVLHSAEQHLRDGETRTLNVWYFMARGRLRSAREDHAGAAEDFQSTGALLQANTFLNPAYMLLPWRAWAGYSLVKAGSPREGHALLEEDIELSHQFGLRANLGAALGRLAQTRPLAERQAILADAVSALDAPHSSRIELARALCDLGVAQHEGGQETESKETLRRALDLAHAAGAEDIERRAYDELIAIGARPRRAAVSGRAALTPSEARIAALFAEGMTSRAIADTLFLTVSTVEWHRRNVYRKLDVTSRDQLVDVMAG